MNKKKQIPIRIEIQTYEEVQTRLKEVDRSFNNYVIQLIKQDLKNNLKGTSNNE